MLNVVRGVLVEKSVQIGELRMYRPKEFLFSAFSRFFHLVTVLNYLN